MRWRLTTPHYLNLTGNDSSEWEYKETNRDTGKQGRKVFAVPSLLNPDDPADQNYPGEVVVCHEGKGQGRDKTFTGEPTPDMEPLDDEARALSDTLRHKWQHPIDTIPGNGEDYGRMLMKMFEKQMLQLKDSAPVANASLDGVNVDEFNEMKKMVQQLAQQNAQLLEQIAAKPKPIEAKRI